VRRLLPVSALRCCLAACRQVAGVADARVDAVARALRAPRTLPP
jgi:hypothetical protein